MHIERHRGVTVAQLGLDAVDEIYSLRTALERLAAEWLCRNATEDDFKRMAAVLKSSTNCRSPRPGRRWQGSMLPFMMRCSRPHTMSGSTKRGWPCAPRSSSTSCTGEHFGRLRQDMAERPRGLPGGAHAPPATQVIKIVEGHIEGTYQRLLQANREAAPRPTPKKRS